LTNFDVKTQNGYQKLSLFLTQRKKNGPSDVLSAEMEDLLGARRNDDARDNARSSKDDFAYQSIAGANRRADGAAVT